MSTSITSGLAQRQEPSSFTPFYSYHETEIGSSKIEYQDANMSRRISPLAPVNSDGFSYGSKGFATRGVTRESSARIHALLFPEQLDGLQLQKRAREDAKKVVTIPWIMAQLKFYGIEFKSTAKKQEIKELLMTSIKSGLVSTYSLVLESGNPAYQYQCDTLPPRVKIIEGKLQREYTTKNKENVAIQSKYQAEQRMCHQRQQEYAWESKMQTHRAFVERYLGPDPAQPFSIADVQGTYIVECDEISSNWPNANDLSLKITSGMGNGWMGVFDFGIIKGVMECGLGRQSNFLEPSDFDVEGEVESGNFSLQEFGIEDCSTDAAEQFSAESLSIDNSHEKNPDASNPFSTYTFSKATEHSTLTPQPLTIISATLRTQQNNSDHEDFTMEYSHERNPFDGNPQMHPALSNLPPRLPFRWRGYESSLDTRLLDHGDGQTGYLDFSDARCVVFDAELNLKFMGGSVKLRGFKVGT